MSKTYKTILDRLHRVEDFLLATLVFSLLMLAMSQIVMRWLETGVTWIEPLSRAGVLWIALLGALAATRNNKHIAIDVLPKLFSGTAKKILWYVSQFCAAAICLILGYLSWSLLLMEYESPLPFIAGIPSWVPMLVLPIAFVLMALRFVFTGLAGEPAKQVDA